MQRYEYTEGNSSKFWEVEIDGSNLNICWGRIGTNGQSQTKAFADESKATTAMDKLIKEKTSKGYTPAGNTPAAITDHTLQQDTPKIETPSATATSMAISTPPEVLERGAIAPWLQGELIALTPEMRLFAHPNRQHPGQALNLDADETWQTIALALKEGLEEGEQRDKFEFVVNETDTAFQQSCQEAFERIRKQQRQGSPQSDAVLLALSCANTNYSSQLIDDRTFVRYLLAQHGLIGAIDILIESEQINVERDWDYSLRLTRFTLNQQVGSSQSYGYGQRFSAGEMLFRTALAQASESDWQAAARRLQAAAPRLHPSRRILLALLLPECPEFANAMALELAQTDQNLVQLTMVVTSHEARQAVQASKGNTWWG